MAKHATITVDLNPEHVALLREVRDGLAAAAGADEDALDNLDEYLTDDDLDPADVRLAAALWAAEYEGREWPPSDEYFRLRYLRHARAARDHIEAEREEGGYNIRRAERERERRVKAEAMLDDALRKAVARGGRRMI